jgi:hypothetical protein
MKHLARGRFVLEWYATFHWFLSLLMRQVVILIAEVFLKRQEIPIFSWLPKVPQFPRRALWTPTQIRRIEFTSSHHISPWIHFNIPVFRFPPLVFNVKLRLLGITCGLFQKAEVINFNISIPKSST